MSSSSEGSPKKATAKKGTKKSPAKGGTKQAPGKTASTKKASTKKAPSKKVSAQKSSSTGTGVLRIVPDTSVIIDGRLAMLVEEGEYEGADVLVPEAVVAELEGQANRGLDTGYAGLEELVQLERLAGQGLIELEFIGRRPTRDEIAEAHNGAIDALIRDIARETEGATLITGDKIQAQVAEAQHIPYRYLRADRADDDDVGFDRLQLLRFFADDVMSVHLKQDVPPYAKAGTPGNKEIRQLAPKGLTKREINDIARECIECARRDDRSFIEIERLGATVVQLRNMRIAISRPPFSESIEITAVRPVSHLVLEDYDLPEPVKERLSDHTRGVFVSGPPGSGKSTFAQAIGEHLHDQGTIVKTMESPRDLVLPEAVTQYAPLERDIELTGDFLLLVRPDFVIYDEVRKTRDFEVFADMRLAGVGLIGVTHANRAIDAVQRLIGRVELGMIPQVVDTVVHIVKGEIQQILEMDFTVRVPAGMTEADLARPVIRVTDFQTKEELFEIYTYGEQVVVMPLDQVDSGGGGPGKQMGAVQKMAKNQIMRVVDRFVKGPYDVHVGPGDRVTVYVQDWAIAAVIGKQGSNVKRLERQTGLKVDVKTFQEMEMEAGRPEDDLGGRNATRKPTKSDLQPTRSSRRPGSLGYDDDVGEEDEDDSYPGSYDPHAGHGGEGVVPFVRAQKKNVILSAGGEYAGHPVEIVVDGQTIGQGVLSKKGEIRFSRSSSEGRRVADAHRHGDAIELQLVE